MTGSSLTNYRVIGVGVVIQVSRVNFSQLSATSTPKLGIWLLFPAVKMKKRKVEFIRYMFQNLAMMSVRMMMNWEFILFIRLTKTGLIAIHML